MLFDKICCSTVEKSVSWRCSEAKRGRSHRDQKTGFASCITRRLAACAQRDACNARRNHGDVVGVAREDAGSVSRALSIKKAATLVVMGETFGARMPAAGDTISVSHKQGGLDITLVLVWKVSGFGQVKAYSTERRREAGLTSRGSEKYVQIANWR